MLFVSTSALFVVYTQIQQYCLHWTANYLSGSVPCCIPMERRLSFALHHRVAFISLQAEMTLLHVCAFCHLTKMFVNNCRLIGVVPMTARIAIAAAAVVVCFNCKFVRCLSSLFCPNEWMNMEHAFQTYAGRVCPQQVHHMPDGRFHMEICCRSLAVIEGVLDRPTHAAITPPVYRLWRPMFIYTLICRSELPMEQVIFFLAQKSIRN